jgi:hypothetical protein
MPEEKQSEKRDDEQIGPASGKKFPRPDLERGWVYADDPPKKPESTESI